MEFKNASGLIRFLVEKNWKQTDQPSSDPRFQVYQSSQNDFYVALVPRGPGDKAVLLQNRGRGFAALSREMPVEDITYDEKRDAYGPFLSQTDEKALKAYLPGYITGAKGQPAGKMGRALYISPSTGRVGRLSDLPLTTETNGPMTNQDLMRAGKEPLKKLTSKDLRESRAEKLLREF